MLSKPPRPARRCSSPAPTASSGRPRRFVDSLSGTRCASGDLDEALAAFRGRRRCAKRARVAAKSAHALGLAAAPDCDRVELALLDENPGRVPCGARGSPRAPMSIALSPAAVVAAGDPACSRSPRAEQQSRAPPAAHRVAVPRRPAAASRTASISPGVLRGTSNAGCACACAQHQRLQQEFQVDQAALALLEVEGRRIAAIQFGAHAPAHRHHVLAQRGASRRARQRLRAHALEIRAQRRIAGDAARAHQRLVFPGPGALALVVGEAGQLDTSRPLAPSGRRRTSTSNRRPRR